MNAILDSAKIPHLIRNISLYDLLMLICKSHGKFRLVFGFNIKWCSPTIQIYFQVKLTLWWTDKTHPMSAALGRTVVNPEHTDVLTLSVYTHLETHRDRLDLVMIESSAQLHPNILTFSNDPSKCPHRSKCVTCNSVWHTLTGLQLCNTVMSGSFGVTNDATLSLVNIPDFSHDSILTKCAVIAAKTSYWFWYIIEKQIIIN